MTREEAKQHIEEIRRERFWLDEASHQPSQNPLLGMLRRALNLLATGIFEHAHHYVFELTQNADDNSYSAEAEHLLRFVLLENDPTGTPGSRGCLCVLNDEMGFERAHVESLCNIGDSTKHNREGYIGEKGIGFKSVFLISDRPHIISNGYSFHFRREDCDAGLGYIVPHWTDQVPTVAQANSTAILLPLRSSSGVDVAKQLADIEPECILFLRRLRRIELVSAEAGLNRTMRRSGAKGLINLDAGTTRASYFVHRAEHSCARIQESLRQGVSSTWVTIALPLTAPETTEGRVFAFLPTEARTGLPFLINADFLVPASRERILGTPEWNKHLIKCAAATFVEAFDMLRGPAKHRTTAYRFIPVKGDLLPGASLFAPLVEAVQVSFKEKECILCESKEFALPRDAYFAGPLSRRLLAEAPPNLANFRLIHPALEDYRKRLEPLGVQTLTITQVLDICADADWLRDRNVEWWETMFDLLSQYDIKAEAVAFFPMLRCRDGVCRRPADGVFVHEEGQPAPSSLRAEWPAVHLLDTDLQTRLQQKPAVWAWLVHVADLCPFSMQSYITSSLLDWMLSQDGEQVATRLHDATRFIAENLKHLDEEAKETLAEGLPWVLANGRVLLPEQRGGQELVTPESLEGEAGWNWVFISEHDRQHFCVLADAYIDGHLVAVKKTVEHLMRECNAIDFPDPARRDGPGGTVDWICPRWLRDLSSEKPTQNLRKKIVALEHWIRRFQTDHFVQFLSLSSEDRTLADAGPTGPSELGLALRTHPWLRTTKGLVPPASAFVADAEIKEFFGDSVPYVEARLSPEILGELGVHLRLSASSLLDRLRQMRDSGEMDEALVVRIYHRLQTMHFDADTFRTEPLVYVSQPTARWMVTERIFWKDAGDVFDDEFGYAELTYRNDELHSFFTETLEVREEVPEQQLAEVWAQMSGANLTPPELVEKRLIRILPKLAEVINADDPPEWWLPIRRRLKVWTTAKCFEAPKSVFSPDETFAEELFAKTVSIAWVPKSHLTARLNRILRDLGCRSLAENLRSRVANPTAAQSSEKPRLLTPATKELLVCWVCAGDNWRKQRLQLEQLLKSAEAEVVQLRVEYWLEGIEAPAPSREADAFWASEKQRLYLRQDATQRAQQSAAASSVAAQFGQPDKQDKDTIQCLLGLEVADARREKADRKWELAPEQQRWLQKLGHTLEVVELSVEAVNQKTREPRPAIAQDTNIGKARTELPTSGEDQEAQAQPSGANQTGSETSTLPAGQAQQEGGSQEEEDQAAKAEGEEERSTETEPARALKPSDTEAEFVHVVAHTRQRPTRDPRPTQSLDRPKQEQHPMAGVSQATKVELEEVAVQVIKHQFERVAGLRDFKLLDERKRNHGYDLLAIKPGHVLRIEIKAHLREAKSVFVTQNEWQQSRQQDGLAADDRWELWNVENLAADAGKVRITRYPYLPDGARSRESGYWVDLNACHSELV